MADNEARMTFTEHLGELRQRIIYSVVALVICAVICFLFAPQIQGLLLRPLTGEGLPKIAFRPQKPSVEPVEHTDEADEGADEAAEKVEQPADDLSETPDKAEKDVQIIYLTFLEPFTIRLKIAAYAGLLLALPVLLYQLCAFVFPGLKPKEKSSAQILLAGCSVLAIGGVITAYFLILPLVMKVLMQQGTDIAEFQLRVSDNIALIVKLLAGFAVAFQFPMVVLILVYLGLITPAMLRQWRRVAYVILAFASALLTPPDIFSMILMAGPLVLLYELSILIGALIVRMRPKDTQTSNGTGA